MNAMKKARQVARKYLATSQRQRMRSDLKNDLKFQADLLTHRRNPDEDRLSCRTTTQLVELAERYIPGGFNQIPSELLGFIEYAVVKEPRTYVEIGTERGATNLVVANGVPSIELAVGVDLYVLNRTRLDRLSSPGARFVAVDGDSSARSTVARVEEILNGRTIDLLFIDGDHTFGGVLKDFRAYRPLVTPGGMIAFHDIVPDQMLREPSCLKRSNGGDGGEVPILWQILRAQFESKEFVADRNQLARGIGALLNDPSVQEALSPVRLV
jgi:cephalosporin hydroxylase